MILMMTLMTERVSVNSHYRDGELRRAIRITKK